MVKPLRTMVEEYVAGFREEPKLRAFAAASFVDDLGVAVATWASALLMTNLFTTQRARASLVLPTLVAFLLGTIVSGPIADWAGRESLARLARWRWRIVVWARLAETAMVGVLLLGLAAGTPTVSRMLPFMVLMAFSKPAFHPTRNAFAVDLLRHESPQIGADGRPLLDERGRPLTYKTHLLTMSSLIGGLAAAATLAGLLLGGRILALAGGSYAPMFLVQGLMHLGFVAIVFRYCHPSESAAGVRLRDLVVDRRTPTEAAGAGDSAPRLSMGGTFAHFGRSLWDGARFLAARPQRPLLMLLAGAALVEFVTESYDGKMIVKHLLHGDDELLRHAELSWSVVAVMGTLAIPALARSVDRIGRVFLFTMLVDGLAIALAGHLAEAQNAGAIVPFVVVIGIDHALTLASNALTELAQNSASSAAMRGRIAGTYAFVVIVGDMLVEGLATAAAERFGIPSMVVRVGVLQVIVVVVLAAWGGRSLWRFGLRRADAARETVSA
jgi:hypothetical protein